jgi:ribosomal silencing factor RsfS
MKCTGMLSGELTGFEMALIAQESGAAALIVVNVDEERPDDIHRLPTEEGSETIDIPVVMISLNSANVLTSATVTQEMKQEDIINNGMPER